MMNISVKLQQLLHISKKSSNFAANFKKGLTKLCIMGRLLEQFMEYYNSTTPAQRKADMEELSAYNKVGVYARQLIENSMFYYKKAKGLDASYENECDTYSLAA